MKFKSKIEDFKANSKVLFLSSDYGTGKTTLIKDLVKDSKRCLFITYRKTLSFDIKRAFEHMGFANYLDDDPDVWNNDRLIVQLDSLLHVMFRSEGFITTGQFNAKYDYIICDESEGLLNHFDGKQ